MAKKGSTQRAERRRGRPREYDADRALACAEETFWKRGYAGTSLDDLAAATGMNRPSLYGAFGDKRSLYLKTLERYRDQVRAKAAELLADDPPLRVYLERFYEAALDIYFAGPKPVRGCYSIGTAATEAAVDPAVRGFLADSIRNTDTFLGGLIRRARDRNEIATDCDPDALAAIATATLHTLAVRSRAGHSRKELNNLAAAVIDAICRSDAANLRGKGKLGP
jgi:TetR/AcrR family transcriptional regulator, copper-responsive repressor